LRRISWHGATGDAGSAAGTRLAFGRRFGLASKLWRRPDRNGPSNGVSLAWSSSSPSAILAGRLIQMGNEFGGVGIGLGDTARLGVGHSLGQAVINNTALGGS